MALTRAQVLEFLQFEFAALTAESKQPTNDNRAGYGPALDQALRRLGVAQEGLATGSAVDAQAQAFLALASYYALRRICRTLASRADIQNRTAYSPRAQVFQQAKDMLTETETECAGLGYPMASAWEMGQINLGFIEATEEL